MSSISQPLKESLAFLVSLSTHLFVLIVLALVFSSQPQIAPIELSAGFSPMTTATEEQVVLVETLKAPENPDSQELLTVSDVTTSATTADPLSITADQLSRGESATSALLPSMDAALALQAASMNQEVSLKLADFAAGGGGAELATAYRHAQYELSRQMGGDLKKLQSWGRGNIMVAKGEYDKMERVLDLYRIRYRLVNFVSYRDLKDVRVLLVNCGAAPIHPQTIYDFVQNGGLVVSTDWAITNMAQAFPKDIGRAKGSSQNDTVQVDFYDKGQKLMEGVRGADGRGSWWLDASSHFVEIRSARVSPLVTSNEMARKYKTSEVVACVVYSGKGQLLHIVSHVFLESGDKPGIVAMHRLIFNFLMETEEQDRKAAK